jgi:hypothetical protein
MVESAALLVDEILPEAQMRQWVLSVLSAKRVSLATNGHVSRTVYPDHTVQAAES